MHHLNPSYYASGNEQQVFNTAFESNLALMLTGPTGCGKTRLVEHMATALEKPLITIACHDDLTSSDLLGRFLVRAGDVQWFDGPLTHAVREGAICYLDEVVEARRDTLAALHSLSDHRRKLFLDRCNETVEAEPGFMLVCSYNPSSRSALKELKPSFRQRFVTLDLDYLPATEEAAVVVAESTVDLEVATRLVALSNALRSATVDGLHEPPSTRALVTAAKLIVGGLEEKQAIENAILAPLLSGSPIDDGLRELLNASLAE